MSSELDPCFVISFVLIVGLLFWCICAFVKRTLPTSTLPINDEESEANPIPDRDWQTEMENVYRYNVLRDACGMCNAPLLIMVANSEEQCNAFKVCSDSHAAFQRKVCYENGFSNLNKPTDRLVAQPILEHMPECPVAEVIRQEFPEDVELLITGTDPNGNLLPLYDAEVPLPRCLSSHLKTQPVHFFFKNCDPQPRNEDTWFATDTSATTCPECLSIVSINPVGE